MSCASLQRFDTWPVFQSWAQMRCFLVRSRFIMATAGPKVSSRMIAIGRRRPALPARHTV
jgi:hypothetical protein